MIYIKRDALLASGVVINKNGPDSSAFWYPFGIIHCVEREFYFVAPRAATVVVVLKNTHATIIYR